MKKLYHEIKVCYHTFFFINVWMTQWLFVFTWINIIYSLRLIMTIIIIIYSNVEFIAETIFYYLFYWFLGKMINHYIIRTINLLDLNVHNYNEYWHLIVFIGIFNLTLYELEEVTAFTCRLCIILYYLYYIIEF